MSEERTITLKVFKEKLTEEQAKQYNVAPSKEAPPRKPEAATMDDEELPPEGMDCGSWFIELREGHIYTCRICFYGYPTAWPYKQCIQLP